MITDAILVAIFVEVVHPRQVGATQETHPLVGVDIALLIAPIDQDPKGVTTPPPAAVVAVSTTIQAGDLVPAGAPGITAHSSPRHPNMPNVGLCIGCPVNLPQRAQEEPPLVGVGGGYVREQTQMAPTVLVVSAQGRRPTMGVIQHALLPGRRSTLRSCANLRSSKQSCLSTPFSSPNGRMRSNTQNLGLNRIKRRLTTICR